MRWQRRLACRSACCWAARSDPVKAYNSNGLWLRDPELVAAEAMELRDEGGFTGLKLRLGREAARDDLQPSLPFAPRLAMTWI